jgi:VRR-NUC domain
MLRKARRTGKAHRSEAGEQIALVAWAWYQHRLILQRSPNELMRFLNDGQKIYELKMGTKIGWPDLFLVLVKPPLGGLFLEMKTRTGKLTPKQEEWRKTLLNASYDYVVCRSFEEGQKAILEYMSKK